MLARKRGWRVLLSRGKLLNPYQRKVNPAAVAGAILYLDPFPFSLQDLHGKVFVHGTPRELLVFGSGAFSQIGFVILDDRAFEFFGGQFFMHPVNIPIDILNPVPVSLFLEFLEGHVFKNLPQFFIMGAGSLPEVGGVVVNA